MNSIILGGDHVRRALSDPGFFTQMPEFSALQVKANTMRNAPTKVGCSSCRQNRIRESLHGSFVSILNSLSTSAMERFKKYLGADELLINAYDSSTGKTALKRY